MSGKARHNNAPAIAYEQAIRMYVPVTKEDGTLFNAGSCPSHDFYLLVKRAIPATINPSAVLDIVSEWREEAYHGSLTFRWSALCALIENVCTEPFWFVSEQEARAALEQRSLSRNASQVKEETYAATNSDQSHNLGAAV